MKIIQIISVLPCDFRLYSSVNTFKKSAFSSILVVARTFEVKKLLLILSAVHKITTVARLAHIPLRAAACP